jgi:GxxExxY protein
MPTKIIKNQGNNLFVFAQKNVVHYIGEQNQRYNDETDMNKSTDIQFQQEVFNIIGAAMEVQNHLGRGFLELVYHEALNIELGLRGIPFETEKLITIAYKGHLLERTYKADLVCYENIVVELKSVGKLKTEHTAQLLNYLKATNLPLGILINFGETPLKYKIVPNFINQN